MFFTDVCYKRKWRLIMQSVEKTENLDSKNGRSIMQSKCSECVITKLRFVKKQEAKGLMNNLKIKTPLSKTPLLNVLF